MPTLKNPRHERFAQLLASGKTAVDASEQAGFERGDGNSNEKIKGTVQGKDQGPQHVI
jgi:hypothetical protein